MEERNELKIYNLIWYFIIFSILGMIVETLYCYITTGVIESRQGLIWGPFCPVYGVGAIILVAGLDKFNENWITLFIAGFVLGSVAEYLLSFGLEAVYGIRFWDYSYIAENINGRICLPYSIFWGVLSIFLMRLGKPLIDKLINIIPRKIGKNIQILIITFLVVDCFATIWAIEKCKTDVLKPVDRIMQEKNYFEQTKTNVEEMLFPTERVLKIFPNLRIIQDGREVFIRDII